MAHPDPSGDGGDGGGGQCSPWNRDDAARRPGAREAIRHHKIQGLVHAPPPSQPCAGNSLAPPWPAPGVPARSTGRPVARPTCSVRYVHPRKAVVVDDESRLVSSTKRSSSPGISPAKRRNLFGCLSAATVRSSSASPCRRLSRYVPSGSQASGQEVRNTGREKKKRVL